MWYFRKNNTAGQQGYRELHDLKLQNCAGRVKNSLYEYSQFRLVIQSVMSYRRFMDAAQIVLKNEWKYQIHLLEGRRPPHLESCCVKLDRTHA